MLEKNRHQKLIKVDGVIQWNKVGDRSPISTDWRKPTYNKMTVSKISYAKAVAKVYYQQLCRSGGHDATLAARVNTELSGSMMLLKCTKKQAHKQCSTDKCLKRELPFSQVAWAWPKPDEAGPSS